MLLLPWLRSHMNGDGLAAIGHRVVHGGPNHVKPELVTPALVDELSALEKLAPLHQPHNLQPIRVALERLPDLKQVACFDTAFHRTVPQVAQAFAIPQDLPREASAVTASMASRTNTSRRAARARPRAGRRQGRRGPSWQRRLPLCDARRAECGDDDGLLRARRAADGHAVRRAGPRRRALSARATG